MPAPCPDAARVLCDPVSQTVAESADLLAKMNATLAAAGRPAAERETAAAAQAEYLARQAALAVQGMLGGWGLDLNPRAMANGPGTAGGVRVLFDLYAAILVEMHRQTAHLLHLSPKKRKVCARPVCYFVAAAPGVFCPLHS